jgi:hypothetical protein
LEILNVLKVAADFSLQPELGGVKSTQPSAVAFLTGLDPVGAFPRTESGLAGVIPDQTKFSFADRTTCDAAVSKMLKTVSHRYLLWALRGCVGARLVFAVAAGRQVIPIVWLTMVAFNLWPRSWTSCRLQSLFRLVVGD